MKHLSAAEFVDLLEGVLAPSRRTHVERCDVCRREAEQAGATLAELRGIDVPEPSPLFWDHFSERVGRAVAEEAVAPVTWRLWPLAGPAWTGALAVAIAALVIGVLVFRTVGDPMGIGEDPAGGREALAIEDFVASPEAELEWAFVIDVAEAADWDDVVDAGFVVRPGSTERALADLSADERREFVRLLEREFGAPPKL